MGLDMLVPCFFFYHDLTLPSKRYTTKLSMISLYKHDILGYVPPCRRRVPWELCYGTVMMFFIITFVSHLNAPSIFIYYKIRILDAFTKGFDRKRSVEGHTTTLLWCSFYSRLISTRYVTLFRIITHLISSGPFPDSFDSNGLLVVLPQQCDYVI